jgi:RNA polymerase sigma factor (sigma-70 family)
MRSEINPRRSEYGVAPTISPCSSGHFSATLRTAGAKSLPGHELSDRDLAAVDDATADSEVLAQLRELLPDDQFQALTARVIDGRDYAEIAQELRTSQSVVRKRVSRALAQLRSIRQEETS